MKKILIATSALAAFAATSAFALDVSTSGAVEYKYTKDKVDNKAQNPKLSQATAEVKFAAEGASNGLAYGAWVKVKSNGESNGNKDKVEAKFVKDDPNAATDTRLVGYTQGGLAVVGASVAGDVTGTQYIEGVAAKSGQITSPANNATTQSAMWVSGSFGKVIIGQDGGADLAPDGAVKAASFGGSTFVEAGVDTVGGERITYEAPTFVDGLKFSYSTTLKGNAGKKEDQAKAGSEWGVSYATDIAGVSLTVGHSSGTTASDNKTKTVTLSGGAPEAAATEAGRTAGAHRDGTDVVVKNINKARTNTATGMTATYGNFTVGYSVWKNEKKHYQTKGTEGSNYGVKYASGDWAVGYTVKSAEDKNMYAAASKKSADVSAYSASYTVAEGFSVYASKSSLKTKNSDKKTDKANYTIIGAKISF